MLEFVFEIVARVALVAALFVVCTPYILLRALFDVEGWRSGVRRRYADLRDMVTL